MIAEISVNSLGPELRAAVNRMHLGESVTLVDGQGKPVAIVISISRGQERPMSVEEWEAEWKVLTREVDELWSGGMSAVEAVAEQRR